MTQISAPSRRLRLAYSLGGALYAIGFLMVCLIANGFAALAPLSSQAILMIGMAAWNVGTICLLEGLRRAIRHLDERGAS